MVEWHEMPSQIHTRGSVPASGHYTLTALQQRLSGTFFIGMIPILTLWDTLEQSNAAKTYHVCNIPICDILRTRVFVLSTSVP